MEFERLVETRRSFEEFEDKEVPREKIERAVGRAVRAPTAFNLQPYRFKVLESRESFEKAEKAATAGNKWITRGDKIVVLLADERIDTGMGKALDDMVEKGFIDRETAKNYRERISGYSEAGEPFMTGWLTRNTMIPFSFLMLALWDEGVGSHPVRGFSQEKLSDELDLKEHWRPMMLLVIGYPSGEQPEKWRKDTSEILDFV
ncbi:MAG: nitroreductase family protein [Candidatus Nanohaloarchaea archaeon]